ncbi:MAG: hypothetical protein K1X57_00065 [Gemmataceae bacterium]|nr:hypothetical protein [Gemmataceae bacterium]
MSLRTRRGSLASRNLRSKLFVRALEDRSVPAAFVVNASTDTNTADPMDPLKGDLRYCIDQANLNPGPDTITFDASVTSIAMTNGTVLTITDDLKITGSGSGILTLDALNATRHFLIDNAAAGPIHVDISGMKLINGRKTGTLTTDRGGSIFINDESVTLNDMVLQNNTADGRGGALNIQAAPGTLLVTNSKFINNSAALAGGAINLPAGSLTVENCTISGNTAQGRAGGIYNTGGLLVVRSSSFDASAGSGNRSNTSSGGAINAIGGSTTIIDTTISGSTAATRGGGLYTSNTNLLVDRCLFQSNTSLSASGASGGGACIAPFLNVVNTTIRNSTFTGNTALTGGGLQFYLAYGIQRLSNCTIVGNTATSTAAGAGGGGLARIAFGTGALFMDSNIIANNTNTVAPDFQGGGAVAGSNFANNNFIKASTGQGILTGTGNVTSTDPDLGPLANNGGATLSFKPNPTSPVINAGLNPFDASGKDQTGNTRTFGNADVGAVEVITAGTPTASATLAGIYSTGGTNYSFSVLYQGTANIDASTLGNTDIRVTGPNGFNQLATLRSVTGSGATVTATYQVTAPGGTWDGSDVGQYSVAVEASQVADVGAVFVPAGSLGNFAVDVGRTFVVTSGADSGAGTLRQAVLDAATTLALDTITFDPLLNGTTITVTTPIAVNNPVSINGPGADLLAISGGGTSRIFTVNGPFKVVANFNDLKLMNGRSTGGAATDRGAAIQIGEEIVNVNNVIFQGNTVSGTRGGAIAIQGQNTSVGILNVSNSTLTGNSANTAGGAMFITNGQVTITDSTLSGNTSAGAGGAISFYAPSNTGAFLTIDRSTLSANTAGTGGAIADQSATSTTVTTNVSAVALNIRNSTISGNTATAVNGGGGVILTAFGHTMRIQNSTLAFNTASNATGSGGGLHWFSSNSSTTPGTVTIDSSVISKNVATNGPEIRTTAGSLTANNSNIFDTTGQTITENSPVVGDPLLAPLADNGGKTKTHAFLAGSPLLDAGANPLGLTVDQRGLPRVSGGLIDVGAFELSPPVVVLPTNVTTTGGSTGTFSVQFFSADGIDATTIDAGDFTVTTPGLTTLPVTLVSVTPAGNGNFRTATFTFTAPGGTWDASDTGDYTVAFTGSVSTTLAAALPTGASGTLKAAFGQTLTVTDLGDSGPGTLRDLLATAASHSPAVDTISFGVTGTITLTGGELLITRSVVINGPGAGSVTINGNGLGRVFNIDDSDSSSVLLVTIKGVTISGGSSTADGGGIFVQNENLTLDSVVVSGNFSDTEGGGVALGTSGVLTLRNSTLSGNTAKSMGGGVYFLNNGDLTVEGSTVVGNVSGRQGGGLYFFGTAADGTLNIRNSTISGNKSAWDGGGVIARSFTGNLLIENSTIAYNTASSGRGGGVTTFNTGTAGTVTLLSSIVSNNVNSFAPELGAPAKINFSLIGNSTGLAFNTGGSNRLDVDPLLLPLANNGGTTQTHRLPANSPAVNFGSNTGGLTTDQRGGPRTVGITDIGAYETNPVSVTSVVINNGATQRSRVTTLRVNLSTATTFANLSNAFTLTRVSDSATVTLNAVLDGSGTFVTLTFTGGAVDGAPGNLSLQDGRYTLTMLGAEVTNVDGFDGNGDGIAGGDFTFGSTPYVSGAQPATGIFRLFGDASGNGKVESDDFLAFRLAFLSSSDTFDFNGNGSVDSSTDLLQFRLNFLKQIL